MLFAICVAAIPASANTETLKFEGATGPKQGGVTTYPYQVSINGGSAINVACDDFYDSQNSGDSWTVNVYTFSATGVPTGGIFTGENHSTQLYDEAAWLFNQMTLPGNSSYTANINFAIWGLFDSGAKSSSGYTTSGSDSSSAWATDALNWYNGGSSNIDALFSADTFTIYTPCTENWNGSECVNDQYGDWNTPQEFISETPNTVTTPEPASLLMLGFGLAVVAISRRKSLRLSQNSVQA